MPQSPINKVSETMLSEIMDLAKGEKCSLNEKKQICEYLVHTYY